MREIPNPSYLQADEIGYGQLYVKNGSGKLFFRDEGGSGLGLSIVKHILEAHQQSVDVYSKVGEGSTFQFSLEKA